METAEHELNVAFHYACELRRWFPWLDCDFDVSKRNHNHARPDIILHRRMSNFNFLVIELKREHSLNAVREDLRRIRENWFQGGLCYRFGASVILDDQCQGCKVRVLERDQPERETILCLQRQDTPPLLVPNFARIRRSTLFNSVERVSNNRDLCGRTEAQRILDRLIHRFFEH